MAIANYNDGRIIKAAGAEIGGLRSAMHLALVGTVLSIPIGFDKSPQPEYSAFEHGHRIATCEVEWRPTNSYRENTVFIRDGLIFCPKGFKRFEL